MSPPMGLGTGLSLGAGFSSGGTSSSTPLTLLSDVDFWARSDLGWTVGQLTDQSGKGNHFVQATPGNQIVLNASDANFNNRPSATWNGTSSFMKRTGFTRGVGADSWICFVMQLVAAGSFPMIWSETAAGDELFGTSGASVPEFQDGVNGKDAPWGSSIVGATKAIAGYNVAAGKCGINVSNGTAVEVAYASHAVAVTNPIIGSRAGTGFFASMIVAEVIHCSTMPTVPQLSALQAYFVGLYGAV
jgi:hypothetical protein